MNLCCMFYVVQTRKKEWYLQLSQDYTPLYMLSIWTEIINITTKNYEHFKNKKKCGCAKIHQWTNTWF